MTEEIIDLTYSKRSIGGKRSSVTRYANLIKNLSSQAKPSVSEIEEAVSKIKKYYTSYEKAWDIYVEEHESQGLELQIADEIDNHGRFFDEYIRILSVTIGLVQKLKSETDSNANTPVRTSHIKLPELKLVDFDGNVAH